MIYSSYWYVLVLAVAYWLGYPFLAAHLANLRDNPPHAEPPEEGWIVIYPDTVYQNWSRIGFWISAIIITFFFFLGRTPPFTWDLEWNLTTFTSSIIGIFLLMAALAFVTGKYWRVILFLLVVASAVQYSDMHGLEENVKTLWKASPLYLEEAKPKYCVVPPSQPKTSVKETLLQCSPQSDNL